MKRPKPVAVYLEQTPNDDPHAPLLVFPTFPSANGSDPGPTRCSGGTEHLCTHDSHHVRFPTISIKSPPPPDLRVRVASSPRRPATAQPTVDGLGQVGAGRDSGYESNLTWSNKNSGKNGGVGIRTGLSGPVRIGDGGLIKRRQHRIAMHFNQPTSTQLVSPSSSGLSGQSNFDTSTQLSSNPSPHPSCQRRPSPDRQDSLVDPALAPGGRTPTGSRILRDREEAATTDYLTHLIE